MGRAVRGSAACTVPGAWLRASDLEAGGAGCDGREGRLGCVGKGHRDGEDYQ